MHCNQLRAPHSILVGRTVAAGAAGPPDTSDNSRDTRSSCVSACPQLRQLNTSSAGHAGPTAGIVRTSFIGWLQCGQVGCTVLMGQI